MDVIKLAKKSTKEYMPGCAETIMQFKIASDMFIRGYNSACEWKDMSTAPKDGTHILLADKNGDVHKASWDFDGFYQATGDYHWCVADSQDRDEGFHYTITPVAWMPLPKYTHKP